MSCGRCLCGRTDKGHALSHGTAHPVVLSTSTFQVWCYACDDEVTDVVPSIKKIRGHVMRARGVVESDDTAEDTARSGDVTVEVGDAATQAENRVVGPGPVSQRVTVVLISAPIRCHSIPP